MSEDTLMTEHSHLIPDDLPTCQAQLRAALTRIGDLERQLEETCLSSDELQRAYACIKEECLILKRALFGPHRERLPDDPNQQHLFDMGPLPSEPPDDDDSAETVRRKRRKGHGRHPIPEDLPRTIVPHDVPEEDRQCACGNTKVQIGEDVSEQVEYHPGKLEVFRHVYPKYACSHCKDGVVSAQPTANPIAHGLAGPGLLSYVVTEKFVQHMPLYRQQDELVRRGMYLSRSTLCGWVAQCATLFRPLVELMADEIRKSRVIQADETPVRVLDPELDTTRQGYLWANRGDVDHPYIYCYYTDSRSQDGPAEFFKEFGGYLQTDGYSVYESLVQKSAGRIISVGCWAHARRGFFDARFNYPREAHHALALISQLYDIEDETRSNTPEERLAVRQDRSVPVLGRLEEYFRNQHTSALPKSQFGEALGYALNHWPALRRYTEHGWIEIDNNSTERTVRLCALGRKNWLFFGSDRGGETAATCYSIVASAKRHGIEPFAYVRDLLIALPSSSVDLRSLLPDVWIKAHPEHFLRHRRDEAEAAAKRRQRRRAHRRPLAIEFIPPDDG